MQLLCMLKTPPFTLHLGFWTWSLCTRIIFCSTHLSHTSSGTVICSHSLYVTKYVLLFSLTAIFIVYVHHALSFFYFCTLYIHYFSCPKLMTSQKKSDTLSTLILYCTPTLAFQPEFYHRNMGKKSLRTMLVKK